MAFQSCTHGVPGDRNIKFLSSHHLQSIQIHELLFAAVLAFEGFVPSVKSLVMLAALGAVDYNAKEEMQLQATHFHD